MKRLTGSGLLLLFSRSSVLLYMLIPHQIDSQRRLHRMNILKTGILRQRMYIIEASYLK